MVQQQMTVNTVPQGNILIQTQQQPQFNKWKYDLFGCFDDCGECCYACWCPCIMFGENARDAGCCCDNCCGAFCCCCFYMLLPPLAMCAWCSCIRERIRAKYRIKPNCCLDCLAVCFCPCCAMIQEHRQCKVQQTNQVMVVTPGQVITVPPSGYIAPQQQPIMVQPQPSPQPQHQPHYQPSPQPQHQPQYQPSPQPQLPPQQPYNPNYLPASSSYNPSAPPAAYNSDMPPSYDESQAQNAPPLMTKK